MERDVTFQRLDHTKENYAIKHQRGDSDSSDSCDETADTADSSNFKSDSFSLTFRGDAPRTKHIRPDWRMPRKFIAEESKKDEDHL